MKTWMITGCSPSSIGEGIALAVLKRGYNAVVTARTMEKVEPLAKTYPETCLALALDVTDKEEIKAAVNKAGERWGFIDVLVNCAGYAYRSSIEEGADAAIMRMYETNVFGPLHLIQEVLPSMREKGEGAIINISSIAAVRTGPASGFYASSKAALELLSQGLAAEVGPLGIRVMTVEPGAFRTHFYDTSLQGSDLKIDAYKNTAWPRAKANWVNHHDQPGDPAKVGDVLIDAVESENCPFRLLLGSDAVRDVKKVLTERLAEIEAFAEISQNTDY